MALKSHLDMVKANLRVPRGNDAYWKLILELDQAGPWTIRQLVARSNVSTGTIGQFVDALQLAGIATIVGRDTPRRAHMPGAAHYRLARRPVDTPRLRRDGTELPEPQIQVLWRTLRMIKVFSPRELVELASEGGGEVNLSHARGYLSLLSAAGIIVQVKPNGAGDEGRYRLARDLGPRAPKILQARMIFDPNANQVVGDAQSREVSR